MVIYWGNISNSLSAEFAKPIGVKMENTMEKGELDEIALVESIRKRKPKKTLPCRNIIYGLIIGFSIAGAVAGIMNVTHDKVNWIVI